MGCCNCIAISRRANRHISLPLLLVAGLLLSGCTHLFFYPMRQQVLSPEKLGLQSEDVAIMSRDGTHLFAWHLLTDEQQGRGLVCYFHGNAQNISTHIVNVAWLPPAGYEVLLLDYRGYGASAGKPSLHGALDDVRAALDWCLARGNALQLPVYALGQSLGAALMLEATAEEPYRGALAGVVADSSFAGYRRIARDAMAQSWLLWAFRYPLSLLVTGDHDPEVAVVHRHGLPLLLLHSADDEVIPFAHGRRLHDAAADPVCFVRTQGRHNAALAEPSVAAAVGMFFRETASPRRQDHGIACP
ncbi:MAG: alpha/beta hydrolase [Gammaproteobacteria bacterium]